MLNHALAAAVLLSLIAPVAGAADLDGMSQHDRRIYCIAYSIIDLEWRNENGLVDEAAYARDRNQLVWKMQNRGDNYNYAPDFRRLDRAINEILGENPTVPALTAQAAACRGYLRL